LPARRKRSCRKSVGDDRSRISSANAPQKRRSGSSEQGPSSGRGSAGDTVGRRVERKVRRESDSPLKTGEDRRRPRVTGDRHPAVSTSPKAVRRSRDRGCNGHRILRRAPTDRRHPGSSRGDGFHGSASTVVSAVLRILRPVPTRPKDGRTDGKASSARESGRGVRVTRGIATGVSEARSPSAPWEENAHARVSRP
jgi:hypothetical protein